MYNFLIVNLKRLKLRLNYRKSTELLRLINLKQSAWNETLKIVMSINCAADECGTDFDHESAMKRCNLRKKEYNKQKELFEKLLNLSRGLSLSEICAQFELNDAMKNTAAQLLNEYKKRQTLLSDINSQQALSSMAIYQSCKLKKFKGLTSIKTKLIQLSKLNPNSWKQLETEWNSWIEKSSPLSEQKKHSINLPGTEEKGDV